MAKALWKGVILAESDNCEVVEGNLYFPPDSIDGRYFEASDTHTVCPWKGTASYRSVKVNDEVNPDAAWYYPEPKKAVENIKDYVAFWHGVTIER